MKRLQLYDSNDEYVYHQLLKTTSEKLIQKHKTKWVKFKKEILEQICHIKITPNSKVLCVGSRYGEEVEMFNDLKCEDVIGIDLIDYPPYTIKMDMHDLKYNNNTFDIVYSNSLDHSNNIELAIEEMIRVVKKDGEIILGICLNNPGKFESIYFESVDDIKNIIWKYDIKCIINVKKVKRTHVIHVRMVNE